jgi:hypothetical protein
MSAPTKEQQVYEFALAVTVLAQNNYRPYQPSSKKNSTSGNEMYNATYSQDIHGNSSPNQNMSNNFLSSNGFVKLG